MDIRFDRANRHLKLFGNFYIFVSLKKFLECKSAFKFQCCHRFLNISHCKYRLCIISLRIIDMDGIISP